jgi:hypothetical protein
MGRLDAVLTPPVKRARLLVLFGGVLVSTCQVRQRRHAEDDALASLIPASKHKC